MTGIAGEPWIVLGQQIDAAGKEWPVGMPLADLQTHASIIGATGSGKSTLLRNLNLQIFDLEAAILCIEPHGDLVDDILTGCDDARLGKAVVLDLNNPCPPALPMLTVGMRQNADVAKQMAMSVLRVADPNNWDAAGQMREVLRHTLNVMLDAYGEKASLVWLKRFLSPNEADDNFRADTLSRCTREVDDSRTFCTKVKRAVEGEKGTSDLRPSVQGAARRVDIFLEDRRFRRSLALPQLGPQVDLVDLMAGQRMILAPVRKSELGEVNMQIFGTLLMWMTIRSLMSRGDRRDRRQVAITLDEFATMAGSEAGELTKQGLAEARKYGASIVLAMQFLAQLPEAVLKEVKTNTLTKIIMNLPDDDQARQAVSMLAHPELTPPDIQTIEKYHFYGKLAEHKTIHPACYLKALPPIRLIGSNDSGVVEVPVRPRSSKETVSIHRLIEETRPDPDGKTEGNPAFQRMEAMDEAAFQGLVDETVAANHFVATSLLAEPKREPDKVKRARLVSGYLYGLQWWLRDAYYWRLRNVGKAGLDV
jgi:energy-coupling factor transporter ATP-binding protein EcfA2